MEVKVVVSLEELCMIENYRKLDDDSKEAINRMIEGYIQDGIVRRYMQERKKKEDGK